jgi:hypothetical protein
MTGDTVWTTPPGLRVTVQLCALGGGSKLIVPDVGLVETAEVITGAPGPGVAKVAVLDTGEMVPSLSVHTVVAVYVVLNFRLLKLALFSDVVTGETV